ncbi:MAG: cytochrome c [Deltaproteobacteria bacterium]|nr:cytochrome c [Deltaproteobacteria bacterium]
MSVIPESIVSKNYLTIALLFFVVLFMSAEAEAAGKELFKAKGCAECHVTKRSAMVKEGLTTDALRDAKGPPLWYAGDKFKGGFLEAWLVSPTVIRLMEYYSETEDNKNNHPVLTQSEASEVSRYLMSLRSGKVKQGVITPKATIKGRVIFEKNLGCYGCHQMRKKDGSIVGGFSGATLVGAGERLSGDWIYAYLNDQRYFQNVFIMPISKGLISDGEMRTLAAHIADMP